MNIPVLSCLLLIYLEVTFIWILSLFLKDTSIMDVFWGSGFTILAIFLLLTARTYFIRQIILTGMVTLWGMRLSVYLFKRNLGKPEDFRYRAWRSASGKKWWWKSYSQVFLFQGSMMLLVSLPIIVIQSNLQQPALNIVDGIGISSGWLGLQSKVQLTGRWQSSKAIRKTGAEY